MKTKYKTINYNVCKERFKFGYNKMLVFVFCIILSGCATTSIKSQSSINKTMAIELSSLSDIQERCKLLKSKNVECLFSDNEDAYPEWFKELVDLDNKSSSLRSQDINYSYSYRRTELESEYYKDYARLVNEHAFYDSVHQPSWFENRINKKPLAFLYMSSVNMSGINIFQCKVVVMKSGEWLRTTEYLDDVWFTVGKVLPLISMDSPNLNKYVSAQKEQARLAAIEVYRKEYRNAKTKDDYLTFVARYKSKDLDRLVPVAEARIKEFEKNEAILADRKAKHDAEQKINAEIAAIESQKNWCKNMVRNARDAIAREHRKAFISGYENKVILYEAASIIDSCDSQYHGMY